MTAALAILAFLAGAAAVAAAAAGVGRRIPTAVLALFTLVPFAVFFPDIVQDRTRLPTDQTSFFRYAGPPQNPWLNDLVTQNLPWMEKVRLTWRARGLPLRDRWNGCSATLAGNGPAGPFSPLSVPALFLSLPRAFGVAAAWKLLVALAGMWLWLREIGVSRGSALFGAASFAFSFAIAPLILFPIAAAVGSWPWVFFTVERLRDQEGRRRSFALAVGTFATWALLGHVESVASGLALLGVLLLARWLSRDLPDVGLLAGRILLAGAVGAGLVAFALLPQAFAILASNRKALVAASFYANGLSAAPHGLIWPLWRASFVPGAFGDGIAAPMRANTASFPEMAQGYFGVAGWALALLVLRPGSRRAGITASLAAAIVLGAGLAYGIWPLAELGARLPGLRWMFPLRYLSWIALAGAALAAVELDRWIRDSAAAPRRNLFAAWLSAGVLALLVLDTARLSPPNEPAPVKSGVPPVPLALLVLALVAGAGALTLTRSAAVRQAVAPLLACLASGELLLDASRLYRTGPAAAVFPTSPLALYLNSRPAPTRVVGEGPTFFPARGVFAKTEDIRTHDPVERRDYVEFLDATCGYPPADYFKFIANLDAPALDFLNVGYLVTRAFRVAPSEKWEAVYGDGEGTVFRNRTVLPRVFAPRRLVEVRGTMPTGAISNAKESFLAVWDQIGRLSNFADKAFVLSNRGGERENGDAEVSEYSESGRRVRFRSRCAGSVLLVASLVHDGGWEARDEAGRRLPTTLANGPFLALTVPAGDHRIDLRYTPPGWRPGLAISLATALIVIVAATRTSTPPA